MLIQFNFENFKTYLKETSLDLTAIDRPELQSNLIQYKHDEKYVKVSAIYGANSSGKSNLLLAFKHMRRFVLKSFEKANSQKNIPQKRFQFSEEGKKGKSTFEVFFFIDHQEYQYGYVADDKIIYEEWLYKRTHDGAEYEDVFLRQYQDGLLKKISMGYRNYIH